MRASSADYLRGFLYGAKSRQLVETVVLVGRRVGNGAAAFKLRSAHPSAGHAVSGLDQTVNFNGPLFQKAGHCGRSAMPERLPLEYIHDAQIFGAGGTALRNGARSRRLFEQPAVFCRSLSDMTTTPPNQGVTSLTAR